MTDYEDYDNLAFAPRGNTDRTQSTIEILNILERLNHKLVIADTALNVLAKGGNEVAKRALEEMKNDN